MRFEVCYNDVKAVGIKPMDLYGFITVIAAGPCALADWQAKVWCDRTRRNDADVSVQRIQQDKWLQKQSGFAAANGLSGRSFRGAGSLPDILQFSRLPRDLSHGHQFGNGSSFTLGNW
ncbi:MAG: hypothetical protein ACYDDO_14260 [Acidiferrobacterales bacterium]